MNLKDGVLAILSVYGSCEEEKLFNLLVAGHHAGFFDAGIVKWGVFGFYSKKMYFVVAQLINEGIVKQNGAEGFELVENNEVDQEILKFYKEVSRLHVDYERLAWYLEAREIWPEEKLNGRIPKKNLEEICRVIDSREWQVQC